MDPATDDILCIDIETASACSIKAGAWRYSQDESTLVWCMVLCFGHPGRRTPVVWEPGDPLPEAFVQWIRTGGRLLAHNFSFEQAIFTHVLAPLGWPVPNVHQWADTQAMGAALNLPIALEGLAKALGTPIKKDLVGGRLMKDMSTLVKDEFDQWVNPNDTPENRERLAQYCIDDVLATIHCYERMPPLRVDEELVWRAHQAINARGVQVDGELARRCSIVADLRKKELDVEAFNLSDFELSDSRSAPALKTYLEARGVELPTVRRKKADGSYHRTASVSKTVVADLIADPTVTDDVRAVLSNRVESSKVTSLAKFERVRDMTGSDGRLHDGFGFCAAHTGRWASYGFQLHNLPKAKMDPGAAALAYAVMTDDAPMPSTAEGVRRRHASWLAALKIADDRPLATLSQLLRSVLVAAPGKDLIAADYSAIEARVVAWLAGQGDVLDLFERGHDVYVAAALDTGRVGCGQLMTATKAHIETCVRCSQDRQLGKVEVLALGFGMGDLKFHETAHAWGVHISPREARRTKKAWREKNLSIVQFWADLETAARWAMDHPGHKVPVGRCWIGVHGPTMFLALPSGREIRYWKPHIVPERKTVKVFTDEGEVVEREMVTESICFYTPGPNKTDMVRESTYGGKLAENATQAVARDLLGAALVRFEAARRARQRRPYEVVLHVHDSIASEVPSGTGSVDEFCDIMAAKPRWADGLPIAVEGYRDTRFRG